MNREYHNITNVALPQDRREGEDLLKMPNIQQTAAELQQATTQCKHPDALEKLKAIEIREFAINSEQAQMRFTITNETRESILIEGVEGVNIRCKPDPRAETSNPKEIQKCLISEIKLLEEMVQKGQQQDELSQELIKDWHQRLTEHQSEPQNLRKGEHKFDANWKRYSKDRVQIFCEPYETASEMAEFLEINRRLNAPAEFRAPWQTYCLHRIHPFQDGNSRTSRIISARELVSKNLPPVSLHEDQNNQLFAAYIAADDGNLNPIITLMQNKLHSVMETRIKGILAWNQGKNLLVTQKDTKNAVCIQPNGDAKIQPAGKRGHIRQGAGVER